MNNKELVSITKNKMFLIEIMESPEFCFRLTQWYGEDSERAIKGVVGKGDSSLMMSLTPEEFISVLDFGKNYLEELGEMSDGIKAIYDSGSINKV